MMQRDPVASLHELLSQERRALLAGDYATLQPLASEKERLIHLLEADPPSRALLESLRNRMSANQAITEAAICGVQAAKARIAALRQVNAGLTTYDRDGSIATRKSANATVERKA